MHLNVHKSNLNYKYMLQFTKMARNIIHVSLGACLGPMLGMGTNYNRTASWLVLKHLESRFINPRKS